jgi:hypothetical protein
MSAFGQGGLSSRCACTSTNEGAALSLAAAVRLNSVQMATCYSVYGLLQPSCLGWRSTKTRKESIRVVPSDSRDLPRKECDPGIRGIRPRQGTRQLSADARITHYGSASTCTDHIGRIFVCSRTSSTVSRLLATRRSPHTDNLDR